MIIHFMKKTFTSLLAYESTSAKKSDPVVSVLRLVVLAERSLPATVIRARDLWDVTILGCTILFSLFLVRDGKTLFLVSIYGLRGEFKPSVLWL